MGNARVQLRQSLATAAGGGGGSGCVGVVNISSVRA